MFPIQFNPRLHIVRETAFGRYVQERFRDPLLFTYWHTATENWVVAAWVRARWGEMLELFCLGKSPVGTKEAVERIARMQRGTPENEREKKRVREWLSTCDKRLIEERIRDQEIEQDRLRFLRSRTRPKFRRSPFFAAIMHEKDDKLVTGYTPPSRGRKQGAEQ